MPFMLRQWRNLYGVSEHTHYLDGNVPWVWLKNQSAIKSCSNWRSSRNSCISMHLTQHNSAQMHLTQLNTTHKTNMCNSTQLVYLNASYATQHNSQNLCNSTQLLQLIKANPRPLAIGVLVDFYEHYIGRTFICHYFTFTLELSFFTKKDFFLWYVISCCC